MTWDTEAVAAYAKVTRRQLQYWDETGMLSPAHRNHQRIYNARQALAAYVLGRLRRRGIGCKRLKPAWQRWLNSPSKITGNDLILWDGRKLWHLYSHEWLQLIELLDRATSECVVVKIPTLLISERR